MKKGFTLIELSIVFVVIGLLIGGVLIANSMSNVAKIQNLIKDLQQYEIASNNFKDAFGVYPGDSASFTPPGDEDDHIGFGANGFNVYCAADSTNSNLESYQYWTHLSQASMLKNNYIPYSPAGGICPSGVHSSNPRNAAMSGVVWPTTELSGIAAATVNTKKFVILQNKQVAGNLAFQIIVDPYDALSLESKLSSRSIPSGDVLISGLTNSYGAGNCFPIVPCNSAGAKYGQLWYYIPQP